jgi:phage-related protein
MTRGVTFNASDLETAIPGLMITGLPDRAPVRTLASSLLARSDKNTIGSSFYTERKISIQCEIGRNTRALLDDSLDTLNRILAPKEKVLIVPYGSTTRQYTATFLNSTKGLIQGGHVELELEFVCSDVMGYDTASTPIVTHNHNVAATKSYGFDLGGSAEWQYPVITITINSLLGGTLANLTLGNHNTSQALTINRTWTAGDILVVNAITGSVQVNGIDVEFTGAIPIFKLPSGILDYSDGFTARDVNVAATYQKRYI